MMTFTQNDRQSLFDKDVLCHRSLENSYYDCINIDTTDLIPNRSKVLCFLGKNEEGSFKIYMSAVSLMNHFKELSRAEVC